MDETQFFHMSHFLLEQQVHLLLVLFQMLLLRFQSLKLDLQPRLDLLHLDSLVPAAHDRERTEDIYFSGKNRCQSATTGGKHISLYVL